MFKSFGKLKKAYNDKELVGKAYMEAHREVAEVYYKKIKDESISVEMQELYERSRDRLRGKKAEIADRCDNAIRRWK